MDNFEKLPPIYKVALSNLKLDLSSVKQESEKHDIVKNFVKVYWAVPCCWNLSDGLFYKDCFSKYGIAMDYFQFSSKNVFNKTFKKIQHKCMNFFVKGSMEAEKALSTPCEELEAIYKIFEIYSTKPISKKLIKKYESSKMLRDEMAKNLDNTEAWLKAVKKLQNADLIFSYFERRLSNQKYCTEKEIWKEYIQFLKENNPEKALTAYKSYTRFFIEDLEMIEEYRNEIKKATQKFNCIRWQIDTIEWEIQFGSIENAYHFSENLLNLSSEVVSNYSKDEFLNYLSWLECSKRETEAKKEGKKVCKKFTKNKLAMIHGNFEYPLKQIFPFQNATLHYILQNSDLNLHQKFYETCKHFYGIFRVPICYRLNIGGVERSQYHQQSLQISERDFGKPAIQELLQRMRVVNLIQWKLRSDPMSLSKAINSNSHLVNVKNIHIGVGQILTKNDLDLLERNLNLEQKNFKQAIIFLDPKFVDEDGTLMTPQQNQIFFKEYLERKKMKLRVI